MDPVTSVVAASAALAAGAYLNAKWSIGTDLKNLQHDRAWGKRLGAFIEALGDTVTLYGMLERVNPHAEALWFEGRTWTYGEIKKDIDRLAAYLEAQGVKKGETVAVFTTNSPEMYITALALSKLGVVAGLVNINLRDDTLKYCLEVSTANTVISTPDLASFVVGDRRHFTLNLGSFDAVLPPTDPSITFLTSNALPVLTVNPPPAKGTPRDLSALIFTSGTTGKPKACAIRNHQMCVTATPTSRDMSNPSKYFPLRTYSPLPLFHGTAFFTGVCYSLGTSGTLCLARKFSASRFFKDVTESKATRILYVGELCRYLVTSPPSPYDKAHNCIVACGNGLRGEIWEKFKDRFNIPEIREFYRSTEGLAKFDNVASGAWGVGKVGFAGPIRRYMETDTFIVKVDESTGEPYRDSVTGFCVKVPLGEPGEAIGRVKSRALLTEYLNNPKATNEKIMTDVFVKGDMWQKMGDLVVMEADGWVRFHDRMGDTFRWKGENVSAGEVRDHLAKLDGVLDAVVYGVKLASYDGQAGAAALTIDIPEDLFMKNLYSGLKKTGLPSYAMPRLVRITKEIEANATFKKSKNDLIKKSWIQSEAGTDKLYWLDGQVYRPLDGTAWGGIESGRAKL
ncbi:acetyl-CoA synthetase-like protein [Hyaloscypha hepaticicola]|uniref:Acetyl-CoA synthetase-like protein n=1 Tax=Hyaloscypha hepaticicola TaxID=2082293 RepID=A0A2J6Q4H3_9HELO|nr:acetyl-CoA synthetase-like protein [Hyaloscypha hepaticicola]